MRTALITAAMSGLAITSASLAAGPDAINGSLTNVVTFVTGEQISISAGVNLCNIGDAELDIVANTPEHAITTQNFYRIDADGITQLGLGWVSHRFCALQQNACTPCTPAAGACASALGVGCSDVTSASLEGSQFGLSSRETVNASTGVFDFPFASTSGDAFFKRLQYAANDAMDPGAVFTLEAITLAPDDDAAGNDTNNASYRRTIMRENGTIAGFTGDTVRELPAIFEWQIVDPSVRIEAVDLPNDGRVYVGSRAIDNGDGTWNYDYAVMNLNSHESVRELIVPGAADASALEFVDIDYHSGDPYDGTDWSAEVDGSGVSWSTGVFADDANANAIRWGTLYRFGFTSADAPADGLVTLGTFRTGLSAQAGATVPGTSEFCPGDCDGSRTVNFADLVCILFEFGEIAIDIPLPQDCNNTATVDFADLVCALFEFGSCE